jgi:hypothetical protein
VRDDDWQYGSMSALLSAQQAAQLLGLCSSDEDVNENENENEGVAKQQQQQQ